MRAKRKSNEAQFYTIYADLFIILFLMAILMIGKNVTYSSENILSTEHGESRQDIFLAMYVDKKGVVRSNNGFGSEVNETEFKLLSEQMGTTQVELFTPEGLPINVYTNVQRRLKTFGATTVSCILTGAKHGIK